MLIQLFALHNAAYRAGKQANWGGGGGGGGERERERERVTLVNLLCRPLGTFLQ